MYQKELKIQDFVIDEMRKYSTFWTSFAHFSDIIYITSQTYIERCVSDSVLSDVFVRNLDINIKLLIANNSIKMSRTPLVLGIIKAIKEMKEKYNGDILSERVIKHYIHKGLKIGFISWMNYKIPKLKGHEKDALIKMYWFSCNCVTTDGIKHNIYNIYDTI